MIKAESTPTKYETTFTNGEHVSTSDTTPDKGGANSGFRPHELLEAALANCMNMTLRMSAEQYDIPLAGVSVAVSLNRNNPEGPLFEYSVEFQDSLLESQKEGEQRGRVSTLDKCQKRKKDGLISMSNPRIVQFPTNKLDR